MSRDCSKDPCELCQRREAGEPCGECTAGICVGINENHIERCDTCQLFEDDTDAVAAVHALAKLLDAVYREGLARRGAAFTVADAVDLIISDTKRTHRARHGRALEVRE